MKDTSSESKNQDAVGSRRNSGDGLFADLMLQIGVAIILCIFGGVMMLQTDRDNKAQVKELKSQQVKANYQSLTAAMIAKEAYYAEIAPNKSPVLYNTDKVKLRAVEIYNTRGDEGSRNFKFLPAFEEFSYQDIDDLPGEPNTCTDKTFKGEKIIVCHSKEMSVIIRPDLVTKKV